MAAGVDEDQLPQIFRHGILIAAKRLPYSPALPHGDRQFEVPSWIRTGGPPAQGDPLPGQCQCFGIKVDGVQHFVDGLPGAIYPWD